MKDFNMWKISIKNCYTIPPTKLSSFDAGSLVILIPVQSSASLFCIDFVSMKERERSVKQRSWTLTAEQTAGHQSTSQQSTIQFNTILNIDI